MASRTWSSSNTPAAPAARQAAAVCTPIPPCTQIGTSTRPSRCCSRTNAPSSPTRPPASCPLATMPSHPASWAATASSWDVVSTIALAPSPRTEAICRRSESGSLVVRTTVRSPADGCRTSAAIISSALRPSLTPNWPRAYRSSLASASSAVSRSSVCSRFNTPRPPARLAAMASDGSGRPGGVSTPISKLDLIPGFSMTRSRGGFGLWVSRIALGGRRCGESSWTDSAPKPSLTLA